MFVHPRSAPLGVVAGEWCPREDSRSDIAIVKKQIVIPANFNPVGSMVDASVLTFSKTTMACHMQHGVCWDRVSEFPDLRFCGNPFTVRLETRQQL